MDAGEPSARARLYEGLHLFALSGFALARPLLEVLAEHADFFVARRSQPVDFWLLAAAAILVLPLGLFLSEAVVGLAGARARSRAHLVSIALLSGLVVLPRMDSALALDGVAALAAAACAGAVFAFAYRRWAPLQTFLSVLAPVPLVFAGLFLFQPDVLRLRRTPEAVAMHEVRARVPRDVVLVILDEFPLAALFDAGRGIDRTLYPSFARLADEGVWFRNATTNHDTTTQAVPCLLTGILQGETHKVAVLSAHPDNLFTLLGGSFRLNVWETLTYLCPGTGASVRSFGARMRSLSSDLRVVYGHVVLPDALRARLPSIDAAWGGFGGSAGNAQSTTDPTDSFRAFVDSIERTDEPALNFLHVLLPHRPWTRLPSQKRYEQYGKFPGTAAGIKNREAAPKQLALQRHLFQVAHVDRLLGELIERLEEQGMYDDVLLVVTADHGMSFQIGPGRQLIPRNFQDVLWVPLLMKLPGRRKARTLDRNVESMDVLPTIAQILGIEIPWEIDGQSALDFDRPPREQKSVHGFETGSWEIPSTPKPLYPTLELRKELFGTEPDWPSHFAIGARSDVLGASVDGAATWPLGCVHIENAADYEAVDTSADLAPSLVVGFVEAEPPPRELAVAINGIVRAVAPTYDPTEDSCAFQILVPAGAFRDGMNEVEVCCFDSRGGLLRIARGE